MVFAHWSCFWLWLNSNAVRLQRCVWCHALVRIRDCWDEVRLGVCNAWGPKRNFMHFMHALLQQKTKALMSLWSMKQLRRNTLIKWDWLKFQGVNTNSFSFEVYRCGGSFKQLIKSLPKGFDMVLRSFAAEASVVTQIRLRVSSHLCFLSAT